MILKTLVGCASSVFRGVYIVEKLGEEWVEIDPLLANYYTCVEFANGRHLPLPIAAGVVETTSERAQHIVFCLFGLDKRPEVAIALDAYAEACLCR